MARPIDVASAEGAPPARARAVVARRAEGRRRVSPAALLVPLLFLGALGAAGWGTGYVYRPVTAAIGADPPPLDVPSDPKAQKQLHGRLERRQRQLLATLARRRPRGVYIVIEQTQNRLYLMKDDQVLRESICSAGSGMILKEGEAGRKWVFDTPRGAFHVLSKIDDPVWKKPDWAFVEEGKPIPKDPSERFDPGALGEYALYFGDGYMIHGTLYERLLGRSVTHGCIRLGRDDLREVFHAASIGTPIYIY